MDARTSSGSFAAEVRALRRSVLGRLARPAGDAPLRVFCSGIGGTGLSGLATLVRALGHEVAGSDARPSATTRALEEQGIHVFPEQRGENLADADVLIATAALPATHPELEAAIARGVPVFKYAEALGALVLARRGVAISGTHGKSTTTGLTAHILREVGRDPTWIVGGKVPQLGGSAALGRGEEIVVEACEFDRSFLNYVPQVAAVLNVEEDHLDCYGGGLPEIVEAFVAFGARLREGGTLVVSADWAQALKVGELVKAARPDIFVSTFGIEREAHYAAASIEYEDGCARFDLLVAGEKVARVALSIPGKHNVANALAAIACVARVGVVPAEAARVIASFRGVSRRFEVLAREPVTVVDDYAHHPTAIEAVVRAARVRFPGRRIVLAFEPHQASRTRHLFQEFAQAIALADRVVLADIFVCRDRKEDVAAVSARGLADTVRSLNPESRATHATGLEGVVEAVRAMARPGDVLLFLGAGSLATQAAHRVAEDPIAAPRAIRVDSTLEHALGPILARNAPLAGRVSFRAGGAARFLVEPRSLEEAERAFLALRARGVPTYVLGGGSNTLPKDGLWDGAVLVTTRLGGAYAEGSRLRAAAGTHLQRCARVAQESGLAGLELFAGIPGTIGGAVAGNAGGPRGAGTIGERVRRCRVIDREGRIRWLERHDLELGYRRTNLEGCLVLEVELDLERDDPAAILARRIAAARDKAAKQPLEAWSAGCIFQNPRGDSAGRLVDALGLKDRRRGPARVSERHANFIVNDGGARAEEILALVEDVRAAVRRASGHVLELELRVLGES